MRGSRCSTHATHSRIVQHDSHVDVCRLAERVDVFRPDRSDDLGEELIHLLRGTADKLRGSQDALEIHGGKCLIVVGAILAVIGAFLLEIDVQQEWLLKVLSFAPALIVLAIIPIAAYSRKL